MAPEIVQLWLQGQTNPMPRKNRKYNKRPYWLTQTYRKRRGGREAGGCVCARGGILLLLRACIGEQLKDRKEDKKAKAKIWVQLGVQSRSHFKINSREESSKKQLIYHTSGAVS